jgi:alpha-amylase/alpha-mannosidase (GH57 family)
MSKESKSQSKPYVVMHGHFYQPPRENPWIEEIELEESAYPFPNWNARITKECYTPNACARINDAEGRILDIINNYSYMSFNFGPTLIRWLEIWAPSTYQRILEADRDSQERWGYGNAIAQAYNHVILPLANERDRETEIIWGLKDFSHRFQRPAESMWLPECAANYPSLCSLAAHGMKFAILSPYQARRIRPLGGGPWQDVSSGHIDTTQPYRCFIPHGRGGKQFQQHIDIFFYDGGIASEISFGDMLTQSQFLVDRLAVGFSPSQGRPQILNVATDGETFGHHKKFGDLSLAYALSHLCAEQGLTVTNYRAFLEIYPPTWEVEIALGPLGEGTSWSCAHGVGRWLRDCGCHTGGLGNWHQAWRGPLRESFDFLNGKLASIFEQKGSSYLRDPWTARNDFIEVILDRSAESLDDFFNRHGVQGLNEPGRVEALKLLEMQRHVLLMYTSCGWFFSDLSGLETLQVIKYAARALQLGQQCVTEDLETPFLEILGRAHSNIKEKGNGRDLYIQEIRPLVVTFPKLVNQFSISMLQGTGRQCVSRIYHYRPTVLDYEEQRQGTMQLALGQLRLTSGITLDQQTLAFATLFMGSFLYRTQVKEEMPTQDFAGLKKTLFQALADTPEDIVSVLATHLGSQYYSVRDLFQQEKRDLFQTLLQRRHREVRAELSRLSEEVRPLLLSMAKEGLGLPLLFRLAAEINLSERLAQAIAGWEKDIHTSPARIDLHEIINLGKILALHLEDDPSAAVLEQMLQRLLSALEPNITLSAAAKLDDFLTLSQKLPLELDLTEAQNNYFTLMEIHFPGLAAMSRRGKNEAREQAEMLLNIARQLNFNPDRYVEQLT